MTCIAPLHFIPALRAPRKRIPASLLLVIAWLPGLIWFIKRLDDGSDEPLGLIALAFALGIAWRDRRSLHASPHARTLGALAILTSVLAFGILPPLPRAAIAIAGTAAWFGIHRRPGLLGLLILSLPVVASLQFYAGYPMRLATAEGAARLMQQVGIVTGRTGVNLSLGGVTIGVDPACSGIRMLWHALAATMALAAIHRVSWRGTFACGILAVLLAIGTNILRATWLALEESGRFPVSGIGHGTIGLICFVVVLIPLWWILSKHARPAIAADPSVPPSRTNRIILLGAALLAPLTLIHKPQPNEPAPTTAQATEFTFNGLTLPLHPLPSTPAELAFAKSFPGSLSSHQWGSHQVILRRVTQATRRLHPSRDCLRAAGFETTDSITSQAADGSEWSRFSATREDIRLIIHERIVSEQDGSSWTDVTAWYWSALWHPLNGPWRAETVISQ